VSTLPNNNAEDFGGGGGGGGGGGSANYNHFSVFPELAPGLKHQNTDSITLFQELIENPDRLARFNKLLSDSFLGEVIDGHTITSVNLNKTGGKNIYFNFMDDKVQILHLSLHEYDGRTYNDTTKTLGAFHLQNRFKRNDPRFRVQRIILKDKGKIELSLYRPYTPDLEGYATQILICIQDYYIFYGKRSAIQF
jgi:hypothetical protein